MLAAHCECEQEGRLYLVSLSTGALDGGLVPSGSFIPSQSVGQLGDATPLLLQSGV